MPVMMGFDDRAAFMEVIVIASCIYCSILVGYSQNEQQMSINNDYEIRMGDDARNFEGSNTEDVLGTEQLIQAINGWFVDGDEGDEYVCGTNVTTYYMDQINKETKEKQAVYVKFTHENNVMIQAESSIDDDEYYAQAIPDVVVYFLFEGCPKTGETITYSDYGTDDPDWNPELDYEITAISKMITEKGVA